MLHLIPLLTITATTTNPQTVAFASQGLEYAAKFGSGLDAEATLREVILPIAGFAAYTCKRALAIFCHTCATRAFAKVRNRATTTAEEAVDATEKFLDLV